MRPRLTIDPNDVTLFLTHLGQGFTTNRLTQLVREYVNAADIGKHDSCHLFRHTMATLMLENGADIRFIQAILGHAKLETTQIYTQVSIRKLKEIHEATYPAKMNREEIDALLDDPPKPTFHVIARKLAEANAFEELDSLITESMTTRLSSATKNRIVTTVRQETYSPTAQRRALLHSDGSPLRRRI